ncbi:hypothetical protein GF359_09790 [candidate division WOR-3 bacterium]|uniref:Uncharacterized protein n=1 Tax=candidate division WOR-3 bacterium TaxID=2052148 RepID=A0A9D5KAP5_UNCW3|nr:hypothetical protein [candidate division WOR-3 bacterium]MBD3365491.1 hypothetical protein [candidate division WOR-3 bacterium]
MEGTTKGYTDVDFKYEKDIEIDGNPGKEFRFTGKQSGTHIEYVSRVYIARDRIYQISITGMKGKIAEKTIKTFFNSFELI